MPNDAAGLPAILQQPGTSMQATETAGSFAAAQARAMVESRYVMALRNPRNWDQVRQDVLAECKRPGFAHNKSAYYRKPIGAGVEGLGIRFVEVALRCMKNVLVETTMIYEDVEKEVHRVTVTDLEGNMTYPQDVRVSKTVERSRPADDGFFISARKNSKGVLTYTVPGTDDDILNKRAALISKAIRMIGLRIIPGDIQDEAEAMIKKIRLDKAAEDPAAERKRIVDAFAEINVRAADLVAYLGTPLEQCSPAQLVALRGIFGAIRDGETTWREVMDAQETENKNKAPSAVDTINARVSGAAAGAGGAPGGATGAGAPAATTGPGAKPAAAAKPRGDAPPEDGKAGAAAEAERGKGAPVVTYAGVEEQLRAAHAAKDLDKLNDVATLIARVPGAQMIREELTALFVKYRDELNA